MRRLIPAGLAMLMIVMAAAALAPCASAACPSCRWEGDGANWDQTAANFLQGIIQNDTGGGAVAALTPKTVRANNPFLNQKAALPGLSPSASQALSAAKATASNSSPVQNEGPQRSLSGASVLVPVERVNGSGIIVDISPNSTEHIPGAISIPCTKFLNEDGALKPVSEIAQELGESGVSQDDPVLIYGECQPCGGGPPAATYVYWIMKSMGHKDVKVLDGTVGDWKAAGRPTTNETVTRPPVRYDYELNPEFSASFDYVKSGVPQMVDARTMKEFGAGGIPKAINIPYESVISNRRIKDEGKLERIFTSLNKDRPVVVYTLTGIEASVVWFALELMGYDARLYSYEDWLMNQAVQGNATLASNAAGNATA